METESTVSCECQSRPHVLKAFSGLCSTRTDNTHSKFWTQRKAGLAGHRGSDFGRGEWKGDIRSWTLYHVLYPKPHSIEQNERVAIYMQGVQQLRIEELKAEIKRSIASLQTSSK